MHIRGNGSIQRIALDGELLAVKKEPLDKIDPLQ
jgi:hypothetical protein